ncbi:MAG: hypothetical protein AAFW69_04285 [Pseudomonadota bacterium]
MRFSPRLHRFCADLSGAVTVDWVVLTAAVVGLGIGIVVNVEDGADRLSDSVGTYVRTLPVDTD